MPRICLWFPALCLLLAWFAPAQADVRATVDRQQLALGETLLLNIEASGFKFSQPDLDALERDFDMLGSSQSSQTQWLNGKRSSVTRWSIQLAPRRAGSLQIPPIKVGKETTDSIDIDVSDQPADIAGGNAVDIMIEVELADNTIYVGAQTQMKIKITAGIPANIQVDEPQHDDARIEQVNKVNYQQIRDGQQLRVTEYTYVLIPTRVGELSLAPLNLVAEVPVNQPRSLRRPFMGQSRRVIRRSDELTLNVIPPPDGIDRAHWLPAKKVTLQEQWSKDPATLQVGDSVTRQIAFKAEGALASQLPALFMHDIAGLKFYPDQPKVSDSSDARGISGQRIEKIALVATRAGRFELPALTVAWWDVASNRPMEARLPARVVNVRAAPGTDPAAAVNTTIAATDVGRPLSTAPSPAWYRYSPWWWICGTLVVALAALATLYLRSRRQLTGQQHPQVTPGAEPAARTDESAAFRQLQKACRGEQASTVYRALSHWARSYWGKSLGGINDLKHAGANPQLIEQANALQQQLYGGSAAAGEFCAQSLLDAVIQQRAVNPTYSTPSALPPLYQR